MKVTLVYQGSQIHAGYARVGGDRYSPTGTYWWFVREFDEGFVFARGGEIRNARRARRTIFDQYHVSERAYFTWKARPTHRLTPSGLVEIA